MATEKQIQANRKNAENSQGPKTTQGKEVSKMNAFKHGILSKHLYISMSGEIGDRKAFEEFRDLFFMEMQPLGIMETLLVDRLFATFWRLRRCHVAETGMVSKQIEPHYLQYSIDQMETLGRARVDDEHTFFQRLRSRHGCEIMAAAMECVIKHIETEGMPLPEILRKNFENEVGTRQGFIKTEHIGAVDYAFRNRDTKPLSDEDVKVLTNVALESAKGAFTFFTAAGAIQEIHEKEVQRADLYSKMVPPLDQLEKLQRYDAHLQRILLQTLHELQRIQAVRLGRPAPLSAALDVTLDRE
ncbi:hypothetical protein EXS70_00455 [Candidatus Peribacteria bacterium]|nr:hypothetical protein [Candidatus Peribacteria bacterium]